MYFGLKSDRVDQLIKHQKRYWISTENHTNSTYQKSTYTIIAAAVAHTSPLAAHRCHLHITIGCMVPMSDTHHPPIAVICALLSAARCPQAMPITCVSLSQTTSLPNFLFPFSYLILGHLSPAYLTYLWTVLTFSRDFYMIPLTSIPFYDLPLPSTTF